MAATDVVDEIKLPRLPVGHEELIKHIADAPAKAISELVKPFNDYDAEMRKVFAQHPEHPAIKSPSIVPVFAGYEQSIKIRARDLEKESEKERDSYVMPLKPEDRKQSGSLAIVDSLQQFKTQFSLFSESALSDMDWSNVVAAGSSVVTPLLPVPEKHRESKRAMRAYYHEKFAPASDVDLFIYGLDEDEAIEKIRQIERKVKDALLVETTTVRTKNAITIASQYPTRHIQIVLRVYKSVSEILTGFDVDCSCAAFDGNQVWASPRALAAYMTQVNHIDLSRRSPSYENRLSKYHHRGFEVYWPELDRSRIDPTIFERSFLRTEGLARLLVLEKLPKSEDREQYLAQRRQERGRPEAYRDRTRGHLQGNIKNDHEDEVAEWVDAEDVSDYHTFTIPYGPKFHAARIEKLLFTKDLLLNAEWNKPKEREVHLHRHPAFFGSVDDIVNDCCGYCPKPSTVEEEEVYDEESKIYVSGRISFIKDDPGRQTIGSFNPLSAHDYTEMAYVGNTEMLCRAIVDGDVEYVKSWLEQEGNDPNTRDYTGRTPLHLAVSQSTIEVVQALIDNGARMVARLVDGRTALHIAAMRGNLAMVKALLTKSAENEELAEDALDARRKARQQEKSGQSSTQLPIRPAEDNQSSTGSDIELIDEADLETNVDATTENSMVNIKPSTAGIEALEADNEDDPDVYDVNVLAWDTAVSPLHLAIVKGHTDVVECLVSEFGADVLLPVKLFQHYSPTTPRGALLTLVLALQLPQKKAEEMTRLLFKLGATSAQADLQSNTAFHHCAANTPDLLDVYCDADPIGVKRAINHPLITAESWNPNVKLPLMSAIESRDTLTALRLLTLGSKPSLSLNAFLKATQEKSDNYRYQGDQAKVSFNTRVQQPVISAVICELPDVALSLIQDHNVDVNTISTAGHEVIANSWRRDYTTGTTLFDEVQAKLKQLLEWTPESKRDEPPKPLKKDSEYLDGVDSGSYQLFVAKHQLATQKASYKVAWDQHVRAEKQRQDEKGVAEKQAAILSMVAQYRKLETVLKQRSAKSFYELHKDFKKPAERSSHRYDYGWKAPYFEKVTFSFSINPCGDDLRDKFVELFNAAWRGNLEKIKELTLSPWTDSDGVQQPPLRIAIQDQYGLSPFAIAVLHNDLTLASQIVEIADAQYLPGDVDDDKQTRVRIAEKDDEYEYSDYTDSDDDGDSDVPLQREVIKNRFTVDNVGEVSLTVKSPISPYAMLTWNALGCGKVQPDRDAEPKGYDNSTNKYFEDPMPTHPVPAHAIKKNNEKTPTTLVTWAATTGDIKSLIFLLDLGHKYINGRPDKDSKDETQKPYSIPASDFVFALGCDYPQVLAELIKSTGAGVPLQAFAKKDGVEIIEKHKFYQGLTVRGTRRANWVAQARNETPTVVEDVRPPVLEAAKASALENVEWLQTDAPLRCYKQFEQAHTEDARLQALAKTKDGFAGLVQKFITARSSLSVHCSLLSYPGTKGSLETFKYLLRTVPDAVKARSRDGNTALHLAFSLYREEEAKLLIEAGADQTARNKAGCNILHMLFDSHAGQITSKERLAALTRMLDLVDKRLLDSLFRERRASSANSYTPLALYIKNCAASSLYALPVVETILDYSKGVELSMVDGEGSTCLHSLVLQDAHALTTFLVNRDPTLIHRENSTGRTPYEVVEDRILAESFDGDSGRNSPARHRRYYSSDSTNGGSSLTARANRTFVAGYTQPEPNLQRSWKLMQDTKAKLEAEGRSKRILVTLNEANEVARRLAARERVRPTRYNYYGHNPEPKDENADEVERWLPIATSSLSQLPDKDPDSAEKK